MHVTSEPFTTPDKPASRVERIVVVGGEPSLIAGNLGRRFAENGISIVEHINRPVKSVDKLPACDALIIIKDMVSHNLADSAIEAAKKQGVVYSFMQRKWSQSEDLLREKGILPPVIKITTPTLSALPPKPAEPPPTPSPEKPKALRPDFELSHASQLLSTLLPTIAPDPFSVVAVDCDALLGQFVKMLKKHRVQISSLYFLAIADDEQPSVNKRGEMLTIPIPGSKISVTVGLPVADAASIIDCNPDALMRATKKGHVKVCRLMPSPDGARRWYVSLNAAQNWLDLRNPPVVQSTPMIPTTTAKELEMSATPVQQPKTKRNGEPAILWDAKYATWWDKNKVAEFCRVTPRGVAYWHDQGTLKGDVVQCPDGVIRALFNPTDVIPFQAKREDFQTRKPATTESEKTETAEPVSPVVKKAPEHKPAPVAEVTNKASEYRWYESTGDMFELVKDMPVFTDKNEARAALQSMIEQDMNKYIGHTYSLLPDPVLTVQPRLTVVLDAK